MKKQCYIKFRFWENIDSLSVYTVIEDLLLSFYDIDELAFLYFSETKVNRNQYRIVNNDKFTNDIVIELQTRVEEVVIDKLNEYYIEYDEFDIAVEAKPYYNTMRMNY